MNNDDIYSVLDTISDIAIGQIRMIDPKSEIRQIFIANNTPYVIASNGIWKYEKETKLLVPLEIFL